MLKKSVKYKPLTTGLSNLSGFMNNILIYLITIKRLFLTSESTPFSTQVNQTNDSIS